MKALLTTSLTFAAITLSAPYAEARSHKNNDRECYPRYSERPSFDYHYSRRGYYPQECYQRRYYYSAPRYYRPEQCYTERRHAFRPPLISFLFGF